ncbi:MAG: 3-deoxy-manno-octulosonate cytidylyltransferase [Bacteriovoracaceae bacterium]|jgi:3-deoxy-manno-octulosonate cytidylyltransferase (CMP-KDO synthetase)|nr:3-deoxy-manno-octulosonate cytidylyltransferase [Bacteriovoracaceae bacterium]
MSHKSSKAVILIPARFSSSRFPGKPLSKINQKPMIRWVYEGAVQSGFEAFVVTDSQEIEQAVKEFGGSVIRVDDDVESGSERIYLAYERHLKDDSNYSYIINLQGDEPLIKGKLLQELVQFQENSGAFDITTIVKSSTEPFEHSDPNVVKAHFCPENGRCLSFSRAAIPCNRDGDSEFEFFRHIGIYCYSVAAIEKFSTLAPSTLEKVEKLEQLRALENGMSIGAIEIKDKLQSVDTPEDILKVEGLLNG